MPTLSLPICPAAPGAPDVRAASPVPPSEDGGRTYPSCRWIEEGLAFNRRGLHACLIVHHGRGFPKLCDFDGGEVPVARVLAARAEIVRQNRAGGHPDCVGCPHLVRRRWPRPRHAVRLVGVAQFARCNIACNYCYLQTQDPASFAAGFDPYPVGPAVEKLIRDGHLAPDATFDWGGGEPTIYPEFDAILSRVTRRGGTTWVHTNGTRFPKPLAGELSARRVHVVCSVDAGFPETYLRMKRRDFLERVWRNLERYVAAGCDVFLKYIVKDENCSEPELRAFCARARQIGARRLIVDIDYDFPDPSPAVLAGVVLLRELGPAHGLYTTFGATGALFAPEADVAGRLRDADRRHPRLRRAGRRLRHALLYARHVTLNVRRRLAHR